MRGFKKKLKYYISETMENIGALMLFSQIIIFGVLDVIGVLPK